MIGPSLAVMLSLFVLSAAAVILAGLVLRHWGGSRSGRPYLWWGIGLLLVFVTTLEEGLIYAGVWSQALVQSYFILVAVLVGCLSLGSAELVLRGALRIGWLAFIGVATVAMIVVGLYYPAGSPSSLLTEGVVTGNPPTGTLVVSSILTVPGAFMLAGAALYGAMRDRHLQLLYIVAGVVVISIAGTLYAFLSIPVALYYTEFVGFVLLFLGFVKVPGISSSWHKPARSLTPPD